MSQIVPITLSLHKKPCLHVMAEIDIQDTASGTAGINLFGFQFPTWLLVIITLFVVVVVFYSMRKPAAPPPGFPMTAGPVMQAAGRALKKLLRG